MNSLASVTDEQLLQMLPSPDAGDELYRRYRPLLLVCFRRWGCPAGDTEDLLHQVLLRVLNAQDEARYSPEAGPFRPYLFRAAYNVWIDHYRRVRPRFSLEAMEPDTADAHLARDDMEQFFQHEQQQVEQRLLAEALKQLDAAERQLYQWAYVEGKSAREIGVELGCSHTKAWQMINDLVAKLRRRITSA